MPTGREGPPPEGLLAAIRVREDRISSLRGLLEEKIKSDQPMVFEVGCGHGHWLTSYAESHPGHFCIGVDVLTRRIELAKAKVAKRRLENILFLKAEALEALEAIPAPESLEAIFVLFPDPWPKKRHQKNRLIQDEFLDFLARRFREGLRLYFRTDDAAYFAWTEERFLASRNWELDASLVWPHECHSYFQDLMEEWKSLGATLTRSVEAGT